MYGRRPYGVGMLVAGFDVSVYLVTTEYFACIGFVKLVSPLCLHSLKVLTCTRLHPLPTTMTAKPWLLEQGHSQHALTSKRILTYSPMVCWNIDVACVSVYLILLPSS